MGQHKTFFGKLFGWVGDLFHNAAQKLWDDLTPEEQQNFIHGSGVVAIINAHIADAPEIIIKTIQEKFPQLDLKKLEASLLAACDSFGIIPPVIDINGAIIAIQKWLTEHSKNNLWEWASSAFAELVTVILGNGSVFQKVSMLMQWAYDEFIKGKI